MFAAHAKVRQAPAQPKSDEFHLTFSGLFGLGAKMVQGLLVGVSTVGACDGRGAGLGIWAGAGRGGGSEFL
jgi:hypothetical protein